MNCFGDIQKQLGAVALCAILMSGCSTTDVVTETESSDDILPALPKAEAGDDSGQQVFGSQDGEDVSGLGHGAQPDLFPGTDHVVALPEPKKSISLSGEDVTLNFENVPLQDVVHGVLGDILKLDYVIEGVIAGNVTLRTQAPIARDQLLIVLESMLQANNAVLVSQGAGQYLVTANKNFTSRSPSFNSRDTNRAGYTNVVVPLEYIDAAQMVEILQPVASEDSFVRVDSVRNLLVLGGTSTQIAGWLEIVDMFDVDYLKGMSVGIFPIEYTTVEEVQSALATLLASASGGSEDGAQASGLLRIAPLESLGSILVVTPRKALFDRVSQWIERLDKAPAQGSEPQLFVYDVQNSNASHLAQLISSVFSGENSGTSSRRGNEGLAPGLSSSSLSSSGGASQGTNSTTGNNTSTRRNSSGQTGSSSYSLGDVARVVADEVNNSLLIYAAGAQYRKIESALKRLDVMPSQVLIEASIIEVRLIDKLQYGLEWYFENEFSGGFTGQGNVGFNLNDAGTEFVASLPSFGYAFSEAMGQVQGVLSALADKDLIRVLSSPSIMVMDNQTASIQVGDSTPVLSSTTEGNYGSTQNISYRDTGVQLEVIPSVNAGGLVTMEILQSVTDNGSEGNTQTPVFFERSINSKVAVRSGESVVLGGLISDSKNSKKTGLPFLSDLPVVGWMFGGQTIDEERQELLVIITPHVMKTDKDIRDVTQEMRGRMKGLKAFEETIDSNKLVDPY